jgi:hypothetical protein
MGSDHISGVNGATIMLVGFDKKQILKRRLEAAGAQVIAVSDAAAALACARQACVDAAVLVSQGSLIDDTETVFNLRDLNRSMEIILLVDRVSGERNRQLRQLIQHPIERTTVATRRDMKKQLSEMLAEPRVDSPSRRGGRWRS